MDTDIELNLEHSMPAIYERGNSEHPQKRRYLIPRITSNTKIFNETSEYLPLRTLLLLIARVYTGSPLNASGMTS